MDRLSEPVSQFAAQLRTYPAEHTDQGLPEGGIWLFKSNFAHQPRETIARLKMKRLLSLWRRGHILLVR